MKRLTAVWFSLLSAAALAACAGTHIPPAPVTSMPASEATTHDSSAVQLGTALATVEQDSAADQTALDSLHEHSPESLSAPRTNVAVRGEDVRQEAEDLFGRDATATFDIDVSNFAGNRRVLEYLEFFQLDLLRRRPDPLQQSQEFSGFLCDRFGRRLGCSLRKQQHAATRSGRLWQDGDAGDQGLGLQPVV